MNTALEYARILRAKIIEIVQSLSLEQLNIVPPGFNNNIAWHFGHLVVTTPILCYLRSGVQPEKQIPLADKYKVGTRPEGFINQEEINYFHPTILTSLDEIEADYNKGIFKIVAPYTTKTFGVSMDNIDAILECCAVHDALHTGNIITMSRLVAQK